MSSSDKHLTIADLSADQREVYGSIERWISNLGGLRAILTCGGLAGSGKSTLIGVFAASTQLRVAYASYTGRAASVLQRKLRAAGVAKLTAKTYAASLKRPSQWFTDDPASVFCGTIHRLLYKPIINDNEELLGFTKRTELDRKYDLIVVDEASMVGDEMLNDLVQHSVPILAVGDHGQLPPVMVSGDLMRNPDLKLEKIHRQAADNPIIAFAHHLRDTGQIQREKVIPISGQRAIDAIDVRPQRDLAKILAEAYAMDRPLDVGVLCWTNRKRVQLDGMARKVLGRSGPPRRDEVVLCLRNAPPVYNGMRGVLGLDCQRDDRSPWKLHASVSFPEEGLPETSVTFCEPQFLREKTLKDVGELRALGIAADRMSDGGSLYDFGYALTVHKSQGSQFRHVIWLIDRPVIPSSEEWRRFAYTAATRASEKLTIVI